MKPRTTSPPKLITLILLTAVSTLSLNMFLPSLANIADELESSYAAASLAVSGYLGVTAVIQILVGPLSDRIGRRPVIIAALVIFVMSSIACALATNIWIFLLFRMLQGGIITGYTLSLAIVRDTRSERESIGIIGHIGMAMAIAPMLGPIFGGLLDTTFGWRTNFYVYALCGFLLLITCWFDLGETKQPKNAGVVSPKSMAFSLLQNLEFWAYSLCATFSTGAFYIFLIGAPLVAKTTFGVSTAELGVYIGSITVGFMTGGFVAGRWGPGFSPGTIMLFGRIIACFGLVFGIGLVLLDQLSIYTFFGCTIFVGLGNGITMPGSSSGAMSVKPELAGSAAGLNGAMIVAVGALLTLIAGYILPEKEAAFPLLLLMLAASVLGLLTAVWAVALERRTS